MNIHNRTLINIVIVFATYATLLNARHEEYDKVEPKRNISMRSVRNSKTEKRNLTNAQNTELDVQINFRISSDRKGHLTCDVNLNADAKQILNTTSPALVSRVYLMCPQISTTLCYVDCTPSCIHEAELCKVPITLSNVVESCSYKMTGNYRILVSYTVKMEAIDNTGNWSCVYQGIRARSLMILAAEKVKWTSEFLLPSTDVVHIQQIMTNLTETRSDNEALTLHQNFRYDKVNIMKVLSGLRAEVVLALLIVACLALLVNVAFVIRCAFNESKLGSLKNDSFKDNSGQCFFYNSKDRILNYPEKHPVYQTPAILSETFPTFHAAFTEFSPFEGKIANGNIYDSQQLQRTSKFRDQKSWSHEDKRAFYARTSRNIKKRVVAHEDPPGYSGLSPFTTDNVNATSTLPRKAKTCLVEAANLYYMPSNCHVQSKSSPVMYQLNYNKGCRSSTITSDITLSHTDDCCNSLGCTEKTFGCSKESMKFNNTPNRVPKEDHANGYVNSNTNISTIYDDLNMSSYHALKPMLIRLSAGETGIILCHRPDSSTRPIDCSTSNNYSYLQEGASLKENADYGKLSTPDTNSTEIEDSVENSSLNRFSEMLNCASSLKMIGPYCKWDESKQKNTVQTSSSIQNGKNNADQENFFYQSMHVENGAAASSDNL